MKLITSLEVIMLSAAIIISITGCCAAWEWPTMSGVCTSITNCLGFGSTKSNQEEGHSSGATVFMPSNIRLYESPIIHGLCFEHIGCIRNDENFVTPMKPDDIGTKFHVCRPYTFCATIPYKTSVYTNKSDSARELSYPFDIGRMSSELENIFNPSWPTRIIVPGYRSDDTSDWLYNVKNAYFDHNHDQNVILVFWSGGSSNWFYSKAASNTRVVARQIVVFLHYLNELFGPVHLDQVHFIGHSLGAQIAGFAGQDLGGRVARITALDPAGPNFHGLPLMSRLDRSDARFVDVLHTSAGEFGVIGRNLGMLEAIGHVDYYANGGAKQPGCESSYPVILRNAFTCQCDHSRAHQLLVDVLVRSLSSWYTPPTAYLYEIHESDILSELEPVRSVSVPTSSAPFQYLIEFYSLSPVTPSLVEKYGTNRTFLFKTKPISPFFERQYVLRLKLDLSYQSSASVNVVIKIRDELMLDKSIRAAPTTDLLFYSIYDIMNFDSLFVIKVCFKSSSMLSYGPLEVRVLSAKLMLLDSNNHEIYLTQRNTVNSRTIFYRSSICLKN